MLLTPDVGTQGPGVHVFVESKRFLASTVGFGTHAFGTPLFPSPKPNPSWAPKQRTRGTGFEARALGLLAGP